MSVITNNNDLNSFCSQLLNKEFITIDTEFTRDKTYYPRLCLLQISDGINSAAFDPLQNIDLSPIFDILFDNKIIKIFHSAKQDLEVIYNLTGKVPQNVFDTQIAASICGYGQQVGYKSLVFNLLGKEIDKSEQYTDWAKRPLTQKQIDYALSDVTHLVEIYKILENKIRDLDRNNLLKMETDNLVSPENFVIDENKAWLRIKFKQSSKKFTYTVAKLAAWREIKAKQINIPRSHLMNDKILLSLAASFQSNKENHEKTIPDNFKKYSADLLKIAEEINGETDYIVACSKTHYTDKNYSPLLTLLKLLLKVKSVEYGVAEKIIATTADLEEFVNGRDSRIMKDWQFEVFGQYAEKLKNGEISFSYENEKIKITNS